MTDAHIPLADQINAIEWAETLLGALCDAHLELGDDIDDTRRGLKAAAETLRKLEFGRAVLK
jgi:hypothetical protein